jgi:hypothetical protein
VPSGSENDEYQLLFVTKSGQLRLDDRPDYTNRSQTTRSLFKFTKDSNGTFTIYSETKVKPGIFTFKYTIFYLHRKNICKQILVLTQALILLPSMRAVQRSLCLSFTHRVNSPDSWWISAHWMGIFCLWRTTNSLRQIHARHRPINFWSSKCNVWNEQNWTGWMIIIQ